jgi:hypothetical protein
MQSMRDTERVTIRCEKEREKQKQKEKSTAGPKTLTLPKNQNREGWATRNRKPSEKAWLPALRGKSAGSTALQTEAQR